MRLAYKGSSHIAQMYRGCIEEGFHPTFTYHHDKTGAHNSFTGLGGCDMRGYPAAGYDLLTIQSS